MSSSIGCREGDLSRVELPAALILPGVQETFLYDHVKPCVDRPPRSGQPAMGQNGSHPVSYRTRIETSRTMRQNDATGKIHTHHRVRPAESWSGAPHAPGSSGSLDGTTKHSQGRLRDAAMRIDSTRRRHALLLFCWVPGRAQQACAASPRRPLGSAGARNRHSLVALQHRRAPPSRLPEPHTLPKQEACMRPRREPKCDAQVPRGKRCVIRNV